MRPPPVPLAALWISRILKILGMPIADYGGLVQGGGGFDRAAVEDLPSLQAVVLEANRSGTPIRIRGNGHSMNGTSVPRDGELLVATDAFRHFRFDQAGTVTVGAGVAVWDADRFLRRRGHRLLVVNDGGKPAATLGGYLSAGGFGASSATEGGFWETVTAVTLVAGDGRIITSRAGDLLFPWLFGSMGQLGIVYELTLRIAPAGGATPVYPLGESGRIEATRAEWEKIAWFTLFAPARLKRPAAALLAELERRHPDAWRRRPLYLYDIAFKTFHPPLIHPSREPLVAAGIWGVPHGAGGFDETAIARLEADFMVLVHAHPGFRRYLQAEMTFHPEALRLNLGAAVHDRFRELKHRLDPGHLLTRGVLAEPPPAGTASRNASETAYACQVP